jgi:inner membrane protein
MLGGVAAGWLVAGVPSDAKAARPARIREAVVFACLGALPDIDLLVGAHSGPTHSIGAAVLVGVAAGAARYLSGRPRAAILVAAACAAAYGSHVLLDWLSSDNSAPIGIMALWPIDRAYYASNLQVFMAISRRYYQGWAFVQQNALAVARELAILVPLVSVVMIVRKRRDHQ